MREFSAQDAVRSPWPADLGSMAVRRFNVLAIALAALTLAGGLVVAVTGLGRHPLAVTAAVVVPLSGCVACLACAMVIRHSTAIGSVLSRFALVVFVGGVAGIVVVVWLHALLFRFVDDISIIHGAGANAVTMRFGGALTIAEIQAELGAAGEEAGGGALQAGPWSWLAYPLWPLQFRLVRDVIGGIGALSFVALLASYGVWWERKVAGRIQSRLGPMRVGGWHGWAQEIADGLKLVQKEDVRIAGADRPLFLVAPYLVFVPMLCAYTALPFGREWAARNLDVALIFILAMLGIDVVGVLLGGWSSNNKWSVYGAMREACQMVSYEIPMGMALLIPVMTAGTLQLTRIGELQDGGFHTWLAFANPFTFVAAFVYFIASLASCKRAPFDLPEAESELVAGYSTEYSGFRWAVFMFAEYGAMFVVSGVLAILFFGAWHSPLPAAWGAALEGGALWQQALHGLLFSGPIWLVLKIVAFLYIQIWLRWTLPRIRIDQVMYACVQVMLPLTMLALLGNTFWEWLVSAGSPPARIANGACTLMGAVLVLGFVTIMLYGFVNRRRLLGRLVVDHLPGS